MRYNLVVVAVALLLAGCASSSVTDLDSNTVQISTSAAPVCGAGGAQKTAARRAAIETLKRGYDRYVIMGSAYENNVGVVGHTAVTANTQGTGTITSDGNTAYLRGQSTTSYSGGSPIFGGKHEQQLTVRMFRVSDPGAERALDARKVLGPDWQEALKGGSRGTC